MYYVCKSMHTNNKMVTMRTTLRWRFGIMVVIFTRLANFHVVEIDKLETRRRRFGVHDVLCRRDDLGEYARFVQELRLTWQVPPMYGCQPSSLTIFLGFLGLVGPHISLHVYLQPVYVQGPWGTYDVESSVHAALNTARKPWLQGH